MLKWSPFLCSKNVLQCIDSFNIQRMHLQCKCFISDSRAYNGGCSINTPSVCTYGCSVYVFAYAWFAREGRRPLTFSIKHLWDVQELFCHLEGSVQVPNGVVLQRDTSPRWLTEHKRQLTFVSMYTHFLWGGEDVSCKTIINQHKEEIKKSLSRTEGERLSTFLSLE